MVAKEFNLNKGKDLFAATQPIEAKTSVFSMVVTVNWAGRKGIQKLEFIDINKSFFHAPARGDVELPEKDCEIRMCAKLVKSLMGRGTRHRIGNMHIQST